MNMNLGSEVLGEAMGYGDKLPEPAPAPAAEQPAPEPAPEAPAPEAAQPAPEPEPAPAPAPDPDQFPEFAPTPEATPAPAAEQPEPEPEPKPALTPEEAHELKIKQYASYFLGYQAGLQLSSYEEGPVEADDLDMEIFMSALKDGLKNELSSEVDTYELKQSIEEFGKKLSTRTLTLSEKNKIISDEFFRKNGAEEGVITTASGLQYKVITAGKGKTYNPERDGEESNVIIECTGKLLNGKEFSQTNEAMQTPINGLIDGLSEALTLMPEGSEWEVYIPSELAFGNHAPVGIEPGAAVIYRVKLIELLPQNTNEVDDLMLDLTPEMKKHIEDAGLQTKTETP